MQNLANEEQSQKSQSGSQILTPVFEPNKNRFNSIFQFSKVLMKSMINQNIFQNYENLLQNSKLMAKTQNIRGRIRRNSATDRNTKISVLERKGNLEAPSCLILQLKCQERPVQSVNSKLGDSRKKLIKDNSKIKKHLVQKIDYNEMHGSFYQKREWVSRYQHFISKKVKEREQKYRTSVKNRNKFSWIPVTLRKSFVVESSTRQIQTQQESENIENLLAQTLPLRNATKKKFWSRQNPRKNSLQPSPSKNTDGYLSFIYGKSLKTIQN